MRFVIAIVFLALIAGVFMEMGPGPAIPEKMKKYFHKKMCYCIKEKEGICWKLKCCEIYKYVPYKVFIKLCKYGECKYVDHKPSKHMIPEKPSKVAL